MKIESTKAKMLNSLFWKYMERSGTQGVQFIVQIVLARMLLPSDYGIIALIAILIAIANVFVQSGFNTALIQKKEVNELDFSSVFYLSLFVACLLYCIIFITAPIIATFYNLQQLIYVLRVLAITLFFGAFNSIQNAIIAREMKFKKLFYSSLFAALVSGLFGIFFAYIGLGVWSLVVQQITNQFTITVILWFTVHWRPKLVFSFVKVRDLFSFGWKLLVSSLIDTVYNNLRNLLIGKFYSPDVLGVYNRGEQFPQLIINNINGSIQSVMLPFLSAEQENKQKIKEMVRRSIITSSFIVFPIMICLVVIAEPLIVILLTDKWLPCVPFLQISCLAYALWPLHTANLQAINALGHSDIFLRLEIIKKIIGIFILLISINISVYAVAIGTLIMGIVAAFINAYPNLKLFNYSFTEQVKDITPSLFLSLIMGLIEYSLIWLNMSAWCTLIIQIITAFVIYIGLAHTLKMECYKYLKETLKEMLSNGREQ